ncbi:MAG: ribosome silencing factor [Chitinophagales bacterium]|nr:ribosome silencing factor [Chitinophagales bacterium]
MKTKVAELQETEILKDCIIDSIQDKKGENIVSLDLRKINDAVTQYFIICDASTNVQVKAIADHVFQNVKDKTGQRPWHKEGFENLEWVLLDYVDVVVHVFRTSTREFYELEELWDDAEKEEFK